MKKYSANPVLDNDILVCDVEAKVFGDRIYLYGTNGSENWQNIRVYSSCDMSSWVDEGVVFSVEDIKWIDAKHIWAPDCVYKNGYYYLYYSLPNGEMGVAKSDKPAGKFIDVGRIDVSGIDPSVLIDDDGQAYLYWGQNDNVRVAKLKDNMCEIDKGTINQPLSVKEHAMHEGSSVKKINGKYYYVYTEKYRRDKATCQGYSVSDKPTSGFKYKNVIIDCFDCDPESWNNHGCIQQFKGQWYIFYHRAIGAEYGWGNPRQLCIEKISFDKNGDILEVAPTSSGINDYLMANQIIPACRACAVYGGAYVDFDRGSGNKLSLKVPKQYSSATFRYIKFSNENKIKVKLKVCGKCRIDIYVDGKYHDFISINESMFYGCFEKQISAISGKHTIEFKFYGLFKNLSIDEFSFSK